MFRFETELRVDIPIIYKGSGYAKVDATDAELASLVHRAVLAQYVGICREARDLHAQEIEQEMEDFCNAI